MNASHKQLKAILALKIKKLDQFFLTLNLDEFLLFDNFLFDLADF